jgi:hypothetical protein
VAIPHEAAISFGSRLSLCLRIPLQILQQKPCKANNSKSQTKATANFPSGRGLYPTTFVFLHFFIIFIIIFLYNKYAAGVETLQSRGAEEYELWLTQRNIIRPHARCVVIDDALDNGSPLIAAMCILKAAGTYIIPFQIQSLIRLSFNFISYHPQSRWYVHHSFSDSIFNLRPCINKKSHFLFMIYVLKCYQALKS